MGCQCCSIFCCNTAPTAVSEALVIIQVGAPDLGWKRRVVLAKASLLVWNALVVCSLHYSSLCGVEVVDSKSLKGWSKWVQPGINQ